MHESQGGGYRARIVASAREWKRQGPLHAFGGTPLLEAPLPLSARSRRPLHLTLDLDLSDPRLAGLGVTSVARLALPTSFHVEYRSGEPLVVRHHDGGRRLELLREPRGKATRELPDVLPQLPVELEPLNDAESAVEFADELPDDSPPLHRVGGHAVWTQRAIEAPACPVTGRPMRFVASIDSQRRFPLADGEAALLFGDGGVCYVFWSDEPSISASILQPR